MPNNNLELFSDTDITPHQQETAEIAIKEKQKNSDFDIREFPVDVIVNKYTNEIPEINNLTELFMPDYQREYKWSIKQQSEFIESVMTDLPIPYIYVADVKGGDNDGRMEIIDGSQRIRTLSRFLNNMFKLEHLTLVPELNGFMFKDLIGSRQLRFKRKTIRFIELLGVDEEARRQIFYRLNSGGTKLRDMEIRYGTNDGEFLEFIKELGKNKLLHTVCPVSTSRQKNREYEEMILRFFAYRFDMNSYSKRVDVFLTEFMEKMSEDYEPNTNDTEGFIGFNRKYFEEIFLEMLNFVYKYYDPLYFKKSENNRSIPRIRFEAISVGTSLALSEKPPEELITDNALNWLKSDLFSILTDSDASNSIPKLKDRTYFVRNQLLGERWEPTSSSFKKIIDGKSKLPFLEQDEDIAEFGSEGGQNELF